MDLKRVSNTAQLPNKSDQVVEAGRLEGKPKSSLQPRQKPRRKQNKEVKTSLLA